MLSQVTPNCLSKCVFFRRVAGENGSAPRELPTVGEPTARPPEATSVSEGQREEGKGATRKSDSLSLRSVTSLFPLLPQPVKSVSRKSQRLSKAAEASSKRGSSVKKKPAVPDFPKLKSQYGVDAWKRWIQWRRTQPNLEKPRYACKCP